jgi:hypothetical protein
MDLWKTSIWKLHWSPLLEVSSFEYELRGNKEKTFSFSYFLNYIWT